MNDRLIQKNGDQQSLETCIFMTAFPERSKSQKIYSNRHPIFFVLPKFLFSMYCGLFCLFSDVVTALEEHRFSSGTNLRRSTFRSNLHKLCFSMEWRHVSGFFPHCCRLSWISMGFDTFFFV